MKKLLILLIVALLIGSGVYIYINEKHKKEWQASIDEMNSPLVYNGIYVDESDMSNLNPVEAKELIENKSEEVLNRKVTIKFPDTEEVHTLKELGVRSNAKEVLDEVLGYARTGSDEERIKMITELKEQKKTVNLKFTLDDSVLENYFAGVRERFGEKPEETQIEFHDGTFSIKEGKNGYQLDEEKFKNDLIDALNQREEKTIVVEGKVFEANHDNDALKRINGIIGTYTSDLGNGTKGRNLNIALSAKKISNRILYPGESISFNAVMGDITIQNGYHMASTIQNGKYVDSLGGGLCQTSTTLYNALMRSDIEILERHPHSIPAPYVPIGEDGAVWVGTKDLKFKNNFDFPIVIMSSIVNNKITFTIYGDTSVKDYDIEVYSVVTEKIDAKRVEQQNGNLPKGETKVIKAGRNGFRVQTFKVYKKNGQVIKKVPYLKSYYPVQNTIVEVGTKDVPAENVSDAPKEGEGENDGKTDAVDIFQ